MKPTVLTILAALALAIAPPAMAHPGHDHAHDHAEAKGHGVQYESWQVTWDAGKKAIELAEAVPAGKFGWRPAKDVRTTAEVYMHMAAANYFLAMMMGVTIPMTQDELMKYEQSQTEKAAVVKALKDSYTFVEGMLADLPDSALEETISLFGNTVTKRMALMVLASHSHEHLGQSIAYARMNGITPPWTAREQAAAKDKAGAGK
jgi:uncharacterized damage-inducible protein DinB